MAHDSPVADPGASASQDAPRKRRRKTASGAQDDCFSCHRNGRACDRKRPYCTQCIDSGRECSGYKTTLTWNVGVASRGKLRGLSCPVTASKKNADHAFPTLPPDETAPRKTFDHATSIKPEDDHQRQPPQQHHHRHHQEQQQQQQQQRHPPDAIYTTPQSANAWNFDTSFSGPTSAPHYLPSLPTIPSSCTGWQGNPYQTPSAQPQPLRPSVLRHHSLQRIRTALGPYFEPAGVPRSASSVGSVTETEFHSPLEYPHTPGSMACSEPFPQPGSYPGTSSLPSSVDSYLDTLSSSLDSLHSNTSYPGPAELDPPQLDPIVFPAAASSDSDDMLMHATYDLSLNYPPYEQARAGAEDEEENAEANALAIFDSRFCGPFYHVSPRLQSLMEYYDRHICPYLVAFDGPDNPYRMYILQLATQNEGLQNAVAALAVNNLRMRKIQPSGHARFLEDITDAFSGTTRSAEPDEPSAEETCYKQMSIDQLNKQLTEPRAAHDDSVVATLLVLCLFHVCDSGFSKFKTQLAGVQKLLALRSPHTQSDFTRWIEMFFVWFDVMTSAVNDREIQIQAESLDMLDFSANLGALEQFSGCDGRLFKLIARLGRLNLLAQGRHVRRSDRPLRTPRPSSVRRRHPHQQAAGRKRKAPQPRSLSAADYETLDGNGWGTPIVSSDDDDINNHDGDDETHDSGDEAGAGAAAAYTIPADDRRDFWDEWNDVRDRLQSWEMDPPSTPTASARSASASVARELCHRDLVHINESFRYSALLYTERLGHPVLPSAHPTFQRCVLRALHHIAALDVSSCVNKFLLWPLFVTGTECVSDAHRRLVRARCRAVHQESGFYNNLAGLAVLERVWREVGNNVPGLEAAEVKARRRDSEAGRTGRYGQAFRWRKAMDRLDGEYLLM